MESTIAVTNMIVTHDKKANLDKILSLIDEAAAQSADVLVLPEACLQGYADFGFALGSKDEIEQRRYFLDEAEHLDGPSIRAIEVAAAHADLVVQVGFIEAHPAGDVLYNSVAIVGPDGLVGVYRKTHNQFEFPYFAPGDTIDTTVIGDRRYGSVICYDIAFPEVTRAIALQGAAIALMSTAWPMNGHDRDTDFCGSRLTLSARAGAFANQMWIAISDHCEQGVYSAGLDYYGGAQIIDPRGEIVATVGSGEGLVTLTADLEAAVRVARTESFYGLSLLQDRRPELYSDLVERAPRIRDGHSASTSQRFIVRSRSVAARTSG